MTKPRTQIGAAVGVAAGLLITLGIDFEGKKQVLGLREGDTENSRVAKALLRDLVERGLDPERARLFVIDGAKALRSAIRKIFGDLGVVQRCQLHSVPSRACVALERDLMRRAA